MRPCALVPLVPLVPLVLCRSILPSPRRHRNRDDTGRDTLCVPVLLWAQERRLVSASSGTLALSPLHQYDAENLMTRGAQLCSVRALVVAINSGKNKQAKAHNSRQDISVEVSMSGSFLFLSASALPRSLLDGTWTGPGRDLNLGGDLNSGID